MLVAACLLASSLFTCEWHRPGTVPRLRPKPVEVAALPGPEFAALPEPEDAGLPTAEYPAVEYSDSVADRIGLEEPSPERFGRLAYAALPPVVYGDYLELPDDVDVPERAPSVRKLKRELALSARKLKVKKPKTEVSDEEDLAYAAPMERKNWLASLFGGVYGDGDMPNGPSASGSGYDAVRAAARRYGPGGTKFEKLARDITYTESRGRCGAVSSAKALGVMQTKYGTAKMMGYKGSADGLKNCRTGAEWGVKYLAYCHDLAKGDVRLTSVCYNQGHGVLTNPSKYGKRAERKEAVNYIKTMRSQGWRM